MVFRPVAAALIDRLCVSSDAAAGGSLMRVPAGQRRSARNARGSLRLARCLRAVSGQGSGHGCIRWGAGRSL